MTDERKPDREDALHRSQSTDVHERAVAGIQLARWVNDPDVPPCLHGLLLDAEDTFVTLKTTTALIERQDPSALKVLATALSEADDQQEAWIEAGIDAGLNGSEEARQHCLSMVAELLQNPAREVREGAEVLAALVRRAGLM